MFARVATVFTFLFFVLPFLAAATAVPRNGGGSTPTTSCSTGTLECCDSVQDASSPAVTSLLTGLLGVIVGPITGLVGLTCNPISVIGLGSNSCSSQAACCTGNNFSGVLVLGCSPISL